MMIKIRGIKIVRAGGRIYYYHRATGKRIDARPNTPAFLAEVLQLDAEAAASPLRKVQHRQGPRRGTWASLVAAYLESPNYTELADRTKRDYDKHLAWLAALNEIPLIEFTPAKVLTIRDKAFAQHKRRFANYVVNMLSLIFAWGKPRGYVRDNPATGLKLETPRDAPQANRRWSDDECCVVLDEAKGTLRVAIALGMFAGMRGGDVVRILWSAYDGTAIEWRQGKTGDTVWLPVARELRQVLDGIHPRIATTIVSGVNGKAWTEAALRKSFRTLIARLEREDRVGKGLTFHGLRSTAATTLADLGGDVRAIQAMLGHRGAGMALHYSREANKRRAGTAAIHLLDEHRRGR